MKRPKDGQIEWKDDIQIGGIDVNAESKSLPFVSQCENLQVQNHVVTFSSDRQTHPAVAEQQTDTYNYWPINNCKRLWNIDIN